MTTGTTTNNIPTDRPEPRRPVPLLRGVAQQATGLSAGFDLILRTRLDAGPREPGARPDPVEKAHPRPADDASARRDNTAEPAAESEASGGTSPGEGAGSTSGAEWSGSEPASGAGDPTNEPVRAERADAEQPTTSGATGGGRGEASEVSPADPRALDHGLKPRASEDAEAERRFIAEHGKRAATLRWDSVGVELTHAAEIDLADRSVQRLVTRGETPAPLARATAQEAPSLTTPANPADPGKSQENKGQTPSPQPGQGDRQGSSQPSTTAVPAATKPAESALTAATDSARAAPTSATGVTHTIAPVAAGGVSPSRGEARTGVAAPTTSGDLIARLGSINGPSPAPVTAKATTNAIDGITRAMLRTERASKPQAAAPPPRSEKSETIRQVQQGLAKLIKSSGGQSTVRLTPKALGEVTVRLDIREGVASARFSATSDVARSLLKSGLKELHAALEMRGIRVERLSVDSETVRTPTESARHEARAEPQASRTGEHSPGSTVSDRPEADSGSRGGHPGFAGHHPGHGRRDDSTGEASTRSVDALEAEPLSLLEPAGRDEGWIRLDTVA